MRGDYDPLPVVTFLGWRDLLTSSSNLHEWFARESNGSTLKALVHISPSTEGHFLPAAADIFRLVVNSLEHFGISEDCHGAVLYFFALHVLGPPTGVTVQL